MYQNVYSHDEMKRAEHMAVRTTAGWYLLHTSSLRFRARMRRRFWTISTQTPSEI